MGPDKFAFLTNSQVMLVFLALGPHLENSWHMFTLFSCYVSLVVS